MATSIKAYRSDNGTLHNNLNEAVAQDIRNEIDSWFAGPLNDTRQIARYLCADQNKRDRLRKLMDQLDG